VTPRELQLAIITAFSTSRLSCKTFANEREGELLEPTLYGIRDVAQGPLPGEHRQPVHS
jgi:hypothetical protein